MRVLLVDDNAADRRLAADVLGHENIEVVEAIDGKDARRLLAASNFDVVVTDLAMPVENGFEFIDKLSGSTIPIIILTAWDDKFLEPLPEHVVEIIRKPCPDLAEHVRRAAS